MQMTCRLCQRLRGHPTSSIFVWRGNTGLRGGRGVDEVGERDHERAGGGGIGTSFGAVGGGGGSLLWWPWIMTYQSVGGRSPPGTAAHGDTRHPFTPIVRLSMASTI